MLPRQKHSPPKHTLRNINSNMPRYVVSRVSDAFNDRGMVLKGSKCLVLGAAYKPDIDDIREMAHAPQVFRYLHPAMNGIEHQDLHRIRCGREPSQRS